MTAPFSGGLVLQFGKPLVEFVIRVVKLLDSLADTSEPIVHFVPQVFNPPLKLRLCLGDPLLKRRLEPHFSLRDPRINKLLQIVQLVIVHGDSIAKRHSLEKRFAGLSATVILADMQSLNDDEQKEVLGEVLADELKMILECVKDIPVLQEELLQIYVTVNDISNRLGTLERAAKGGESKIKQIQRGVA